MTNGVRHPQPHGQTCYMRSTRFVAQRHPVFLCHHHYPNILFHLWHHSQLSTTPSPPSSPDRWRKPFAWCAVSVWGCRLTWCSWWLIPVCSLTPLPLYPVSFCLCPPLKANLVAAFEQSLALMTARLQTLSVSSGQKVSQDSNESITCEVKSMTDPCLHCSGAAIQRTRSQKRACPLVIFTVVLHVGFRPPLLTIDEWCDSDVSMLSERKKTSILLFTQPSHQQESDLI